MTRMPIRAAAAFLLLLATTFATATPRAVPVQRPGVPSIEVWQVDQVRLAPNTPAAVLAALAPDHDMAAVVKRLTGMGVSFTRVRVGLLPDRMPPGLRDKLSRLPPGEPFVLPGHDYISVNVIVGRRLPPNTVRLVPPSAPPSQQG